MGRSLSKVKKPKGWSQDEAFRHFKTTNTYGRSKHILRKQAAQIEEQLQGKTLNQGKSWTQIQSTIEDQITSVDRINGNGNARGNENKLAKHQHLQSFHLRTNFEKAATDTSFIHTVLVHRSQKSLGYIAEVENQRNVKSDFYLTKDYQITADNEYEADVSSIEDDVETTSCFEDDFERRDIFDDGEINLLSNPITSVRSPRITHNRVHIEKNAFESAPQIVNPPKQTTRVPMVVNGQIFPIEVGRNSDLAVTYDLLEYFGQEKKRVANCICSIKRRLGSTFLFPVFVHGEVAYIPLDETDEALNFYHDISSLKCMQSLYER